MRVPVISVMLPSLRLLVAMVSAVVMTAVVAEEGEVAQMDGGAPGLATLHPGLDNKQMKQVQQTEAALVVGTLKAVAAAKGDYEKLLNNGTCVGASCSNVTLHSDEPSGAINVHSLLNTKIRSTNSTVNVTKLATKPMNESDTRGFQGNYEPPKSASVPINKGSNAIADEDATDLDAALLEDEVY